MSPRRPLLLFLFAALWLPAASLADDTALTLRVDPTFSRSRLTAAEQSWYDRLWAHSAGCAATVTTRSLYDDTSTYGR